MIRLTIAVVSLNVFACTAPYGSAFSLSSSRVPFVTIPLSPVVRQDLERHGATVRTRLQASARFTSNTITPRISSSDLNELWSSKGYSIIPDFLPANLVKDLELDVLKLRSAGHFKVAKIGQDSTNTLNTDIRWAETCFLGPEKTFQQDVSDSARCLLYYTLENLREDLSAKSGEGTHLLDPKLTELLYAYYPTGGFYRRHRDAVSKSASTLRVYSFLLYLNTRWKEEDGGCLRLHFDRGGDKLPPGEPANYVDVEPKGGTLVLFRSEQVPHEVLDTNAERMAVVGWYNRPVSPMDIASLVPSTEGNMMRSLMLIIAAALVTAGAITLVQT